MSVYIPLLAAWLDQAQRILPNVPRLSSAPCVQSGSETSLSCMCQLLGSQRSKVSGCSRWARSIQWCHHHSLLRAWRAGHVACRLEYASCMRAKVIMSLSSSIRESTQIHVPCHQSNSRWDGQAGTCSYMYLVADTAARSMERQVTIIAMSLYEAKCAAPWLISAFRRSSWDQRGRNYSL